MAQESETLSGGTTINHFDTGNAQAFMNQSEANFSAEFARIGLGICYDVRFPELAATNARQGPLHFHTTQLRAHSSRTPGCQVLIYPSAFNTTTGPLHWELLNRARYVHEDVVSKPGLMTIVAVRSTTKCISPCAALPGTSRKDTML